MASTFTLTSGSYDGRYMELVCTQTKDVANNKSTISWTLHSKGGNSNYYSTGPTSVTINGSQVYYLARKAWDSKVFPAAKGSASGTLTVDHNSDGSKSISVNMTTAIYVGATSSYSETWALDSIPRQAKLTLAQDFTDLQNPTISYSNPAGNSVSSLMACISLTKEKDDIAYRYISKTGSSYTFNLTESERDLLRNNTSGTERDIYFFVRTIIGTVQYHSMIKKTLTIVASEATKPTVTFSHTLNNGLVPSAFAGLYIQGKSKVNVSLSATCKYKASIKSYSATVDGKVYNAQSFTSDVIKNPGKVWIAAYAKDSRGFTDDYSNYITVIEYSKPLVIPVDSDNAIKCYRSDGNGKMISNSTSIWIKAKRSYYSVAGKNTCALQWRCKLVSEIWNDATHTWSDLISGSNTTTDEFDALIPDKVFEKKNAYTVQIRAIDAFGEYSIKTMDIPTQDVALHLGHGGKNVSIGAYCDYSEEYTFYCEWKAKFDKDINGTYIRTIRLSAESAFQIKSKFDVLNQNGYNRQSFFIFGTAQFTPVYGTAMVANNGYTAWGGTDGVTLTASGDGVVEVRLPSVVYDEFTILSANPFEIV